MTIKENNDCAEKIEALEKQAAAMRCVLNEVRYDKSRYALSDGLCVKIQNVLSGDAGRDYFSRAQMQTLVNAHVAILEICKGMPSEITSIARDALDYAGSLGF